jgi:hypothetical protein
MLRNRTFKASCAILWVGAICSALQRMILPVTLHFRDPTIDYWFFVITFVALPLGPLWLALTTSTTFIRYTAIIVSILLIPPAALFGIFAVAFNSPSNVDGLEKLGDLESGGVHYRLYICHCGPLVSDDLQLRSERDFGAFKLSKTIWWYVSKAENATLRLSAKKGGVEVIDGENVLYKVAEIR